VKDKLLTSYCMSSHANSRIFLHWCIVVQGKLLILYCMSSYLYVTAPAPINEFLRNVPLNCSLTNILLNCTVQSSVKMDTNIGHYSLRLRRVSTRFWSTVR
jgi:hypothetical protein